MRKAALVTVSCLIAVAMFFGPVGCAGPAVEKEPVKEPTVEKEPVKIGLMSVTGGTSEYAGMQMYAGMNLAIEEINEAGGVLGRPVEGIIYNEGYKVEEVVSATKQAISDDCKAIVGWLDGMLAGAGIPLAKDAGLPTVVTYGTAIDVVNPDHYTAFHTTLYFSQWDAGVMKWLEAQGVKSLGLLTIDAELGHGMDAVFRGYYDRPGSPVKITDSLFYPYFAGMEIGPDIAKIVANDPDMIYLTAWYGPPVTVASKKLTELGYTGIVMLGIGAVNPALIGEIGELCEGMYSPELWVPDPSIPANQKFTGEFQAMHGFPPDSFSATAYIGMKCLLLAMNQAGTADDANKIADAMYELDWMTPTGAKVEFLPGGQLLMPSSYIIQAKGGKVVIVENVPLTVEDYTWPLNWPELVK